MLRTSLRDRNSFSFRHAYALQALHSLSVYSSHSRLAAAGGLFSVRHGYARRRFNPGRYGKWAKMNSAIACDWKNGRATPWPCRYSQSFLILPFFSPDTSRRVYRDLTVSQCSLCNHHARIATLSDFQHTTFSEQLVHWPSSSSYKPCYGIHKSVQDYRLTLTISTPFATSHTCCRVRPLYINFYVHNDSDIYRNNGRRSEGRVRAAKGE
jgi:hypothetical protein